MPLQRRKHLRLPLECTTYIEVPTSRVSQDRPQRTIACRSHDVSRGGLQITLAEELAVGAIMNIGIGLPGAAAPLHVAGEVRWCLQNNDPQHPWMAGFQLLNAEHTDYARWLAWIAEMEN